MKFDVITGNPTIAKIKNGEYRVVVTTPKGSLLEYPNIGTIIMVDGENENYLANLEFTERINNKMNEKYPGLSKGIYKKSGPLVNGVYNQDFSSFTILLEVGGFESTTTEVLNSSLAFAECFLEVIRTYYE